MNNPVSEIMSTHLLTVSPTDNLEKVKEIFDKYNIHHVPVVRYKELVGLISKTDFYKALHGSRLNGYAPNGDSDMLKNRTAEDLMTRGLAKISPDDKIGVAAEIFLDNHFHAVPVVNDEGDLVGMVTTYDIIKYCFRIAYPSQDVPSIVE